MGLLRYEADLSVDLINYQFYVGEGAEVTLVSLVDTDRYLDRRRMDMYASAVYLSGCMLRVDVVLTRVYVVLSSMINVLGPDVMNVPRIV